MAGIRVWKTLRVHLERVYLGPLFGLLSAHDSGNQSVGACLALKKPDSCAEERTSEYSYPKHGGRYV